METVQMNELSFEAYTSLTDIFGKDMINKLKNGYKNDCMMLAQVIKHMLNTNGILAEIITFKNGNTFTDGGISIDSNRVFTHHTIVLMGEWVIDLLHTDKIIKTKDYITKLQKYNPKLRIDYALSTGWYTDDGYLYNPSIDDLLNYKY